MKKIVAIFFLAAYAATAFGVVARFHFCGQVLTNISISGLKAKNECNCHSYMPKDCCKDKTICFQITSRRIAQQPFILAPKFHQADLVASPELQLVPRAANFYKPTLIFRRYQRTVPQTIYLLDRVFRI
jgi:hypothetical protein